MFAAASLTDSLSEVGELYEYETGVEVSYSFGASQALAYQISRGAPVDIFIGAGELPVQFLVERGMVDPDYVRDILTNKLVIAVRKGSTKIASVSDLESPNITKIAIADPELAPAGTYAKESLLNLGLWLEVYSKFVIAPDVRAALAYVQTGNVDAALVYSTDVMVSDQLAVVDVIPSDSYSTIVYPVAMTKIQDSQIDAERFLLFFGERLCFIGL